MKIISIILCLCALFSSCDFPAPSDAQQGPHVRDEAYEKIANRVTRQAALKLLKKYDLHCVGIGGGMMSHIRKMSMSFHLFHEIDLKEARRLLINASKEYLEDINSNKEIRPYLQNYPFTYKNIRIMIWVREPNGGDALQGKISFAYCEEGILVYKVAVRAKNHFSEQIHEETYEEALKILKEESTIDQPTDS